MARTETRGTGRDLKKKVDKMEERERIRVTEDKAREEEEERLLLLLLLGILEILEIL